jgi:hypothetical protein
MTAKCPWCGAKPSADPKFAGFGFNQPGRFGYHVFECGYSTNAAHNTGCRNRDERTTRDETTQPPEAEEPEAMSQTTESQEIEDALADPESLMFDKDRVLPWLNGIRTAIEASPDKEPDTLAAIAKMLDAVQEVEDAFLPF